VQLITYPDKEGYSSISDRRRETIKEHVPSQASGSVTYDGKKETRNSIPVKFENVEKQEQAHFDKEYRPIPGGCQMSIVSKGGWATLGTPAYDSVNNEQVWVTAGHVLDRSSGKELEQAEGTATGCSSTRSIPFEDGDAGLIDAGVDSTSARWAIASGSGDYDWDIQGIVYTSRIKDMIANGEKSRFQGAKTGRSHSQVTDYFPSSSGSTSGPIVEIDHDSEPGDSGAPYFELDSDGAYIMGIHDDGSDDETRAWGNTMEYIETELNISV